MDRQEQYPRRDGDRRHKSRNRFGRFVAIAIFVFGGVLFFQDQLREPVKDFWRGTLEPLVRTGEIPPKPDKVLAPGETPWLVPADFIENPEDQHEARQFAPPEPQALQLSIARQFRPVGFKIGVRGLPMSLRDNPPDGLSVSANLSGHRQLWGRIPFHQGGPMDFVIDLRNAGPVLIADLNRDGDLGNDVLEFPTRGSGYFGVLLKLPMGEISGVPALSGVDYTLWLYAKREDLDKGVLRYYPRTQLGGEIRLGGEAYPAWLSDNLKTDGDYRNDGISIDLDRDGGINRPQEYFAPGKPVILGDRAWRVEIAD